MRPTLAALLAALMLTPISLATAGSRAVRGSPSFDPADFAPIIYLHGDDHLRPASAAASLSKAMLWWHHRRCRDDHLSSFNGSRLHIERLASGSFVHRASQGIFRRCQLGGRVFRSDELTRPLERSSPVPRREGFYLAFPGGSFKFGEPNRSKTPKRTYEGAPVYAFVGPNYVAYWFFYPYSSPVKAWELGKRRDAAHEGDWENVTVDVEDGVPRHIAYFAHGAPVICNWRDAPQERGHPVVYSAWGSHASYATAGPHPPVDSAEAGRRWDSARDLHVLPAAADGARLKQSEDPEVAWYGYGGGWGRVGKAASAKPLPGATETTGPLGPSRYKRGLPRAWLPSPVCK